MSQELIRDITQSYLNTTIPELNSGDTVSVRVRIKEGGKERIQAYEGTVIRIKGGGISRTITVRRVFQGIGVERTFFLHSPRIEKFIIKRRGSVRRARLYYLRELSGKAARIKEKQQAR